MELELLNESSLPPQEMRERLKNADRKMKIMFFILKPPPDIFYFSP